MTAPTPPVEPLSLRGKRITVMGLGRFGGGVGVTRYLVAQGADVVLTDSLSAEDLRDSLAQLAGLGFRTRLGGHDTKDFTDADLIVVNPAVDQRANAYLDAARARGVPTTSEMRLLIDALRARNANRTVGITGSAGKSTTTAMISHILDKTLSRSEAPAGTAPAEPPRVWTGGNLGGSLLAQLPRIRPHDWIVLELSSFMLEDMRHARLASAGDADPRLRLRDLGAWRPWSPHIAVVTNLANNHLDRHGTMEAYALAKQEVFENQSSHDHAIVGSPIFRNLLTPRTSRVTWLDTFTNGAKTPEIKLLIPGSHNVTNARLAIDTAVAAGIDRADAAAALADFAGLPHRLQFVCEHAGVRYFNDSKATTPDSAELGLRSFEPGIVHLIAGGYDKKSDLTPFARLAGERCRAIYTIGATGDAIASAAQSVAGASGCEVVRAGTLDAALAATVTRVRVGDVVLLSPACASYGQFTHFEARGAAFVEAVLKYTGEGAPAPKPR